MPAANDDDLSAQLAALFERVARLEGADATRPDIARTLGNHGRLISGWGKQINGRVDRLDAKLRGEIDELRGEMREGFSTLATGMAQITALLTNKDRESDDEPSSS